MKLIPLTGKHGTGKFAMVDDEDYSYLIKFTWSAVKIQNTEIFYACKGSGKSGGRVYMHRIIMNITNSKIFIDHKDRNPLNNQRNNLREATCSENGRNSGITRSTSSKYRGVVRVGIKNKYWYAFIRINSKEKIFIGSFPFTEQGEIDAAKRYDAAARYFHKEFATLNFK